MAVLPLRVYPDPILKAPAKDVSRITPHIDRHIEDMIQSMYAFPRCVGLAAPQLGIPFRIAVMDTSKHPKTSKHHGLFVLVNPVLSSGYGEWLLREGCASVPDYTGNVRRYKKIAVTCWDRHGNSVALEAEGFEAAVVQHELDHLSGLLFLDRLAGEKDLFSRKNYS